MAYLDNSGLYVKTGLEQTVPLTGGEYRTYGELREIELKLDLTKATAIGAPFIVNDQVFFPKGVVVQEVEWYADAAAAGSSSTLDLGLVAVDRVTEIDFNGLLAAVAQATITAGTKTVVVKGGTGAGALIGGSATTSTGYVCMNFNTAAFTGGTLRVRIRYFRP
jgi:hypothetical protein